MSANGRVRAKFEGASHSDGYGTNLGQAGHRSGAQPEQTIVESDLWTTFAAESRVISGRPFLSALTQIAVSLPVPPSVAVAGSPAAAGWRLEPDNPMPTF
jgi:hypothetical protein